MTFLEAASVLTQFFGAIWRFFSGITIPVIGVSGSSFLIGVFLARFSLLIFRKAIGSGSFASYSDLQAHGAYRNNKE